MTATDTSQTTLRSGADPSRRPIGGLVLTGAVLTLVGGNLHPRADTDAEYEEAVAGMLEHSAWTISHVLTAIGVACLAAGFALWARTPRVRSDAPLALVVKIAVAGAVVQFVELVPHTFADADRDELLAGSSTPLLDAHMVLQAISTPLLGLGVAAVAVLEARHNRAWTRLVAALAVIGGVAYALAGPVLLITENPALSPLFAGGSGISIFGIVLGARILRSGAEPTIPAT